MSEQYALLGIRFHSPKGTVYTPGFFCQLIVSLFETMNVSKFSIPLLFIDKLQIFKEDILLVCENGAIIRCPGLFEGELIVMVEHTRRSIVVAMNATYPDLDDTTSAFRRLIQDKFPQ